MPNKEEILKKIAVAVVEYDEDEIGGYCQEALDASIDPLEIILEGLASGMLEVGKLFEKQEYFVPEVLMCADALNIGLETVTPHLPAGGGAKKGKVVIGTVQGDVHDIGKNLIKLMSDISGYEIIDLGNDVPLDKFVEVQKETNADIVAMSAMMTTTMMGMKKVIKMVKENDPDCGIILGGAPLTPQVVKLFGADGFADSAGSVVEELDRMMVQISQARASA